MKRNKNLRNLSSDHHKALVLVRRINSSIKEDMDILVLNKQVQDVFIKELEPHFELEERSLLPELEKIGEHGLVEITINDHTRMRQLVKSLDKPGNLEAFAALLKKHVNFEEQVLFNACQDLLDKGALEKIGLICAIKDN